MFPWLAGVLSGSLLAAAPQTSELNIAAPQVAAQPSPRRPKLKRKTAQGMLLGGALGTAGMTWISGLVAARYLDSGDASLREAGRLMPIPVAGPIIAASASDDPEQRVVASLGVYQGVSIAILTIGAVSEHRHRQLDRFEGRPRRVDKSSGVLLVTQGIVWLGLSYGMTYGFSADRAKRGDAFSRRMQVPLVGGFLAAADSPDYTRGFLGLTSSAVQLASAACIAVGATAIARRRRSQRLSILPLPQPDGATITASMRF